MAVFVLFLYIFICHVGLHISIYKWACNLWAVFSKNWALCATRFVVSGGNHTYVKIQAGNIKLRNTHEH